MLAPVLMAFQAVDPFTELGERRLHLSDVRARIGHDASAFHVLGGNQSDRVTISRLSKQRLVAARRPAYRAQPANVRPIPLAASGSLSVNEA